MTSADLRSRDEPTSLSRQLGIWSSMAVVIGLTIGSGIFRTPSAIAARLPSGPLMIAIWAGGGLVALCGALTLAEVSSAYSQTGGLYIYIRNAFGRLPAFLFGWTSLTIVGAAALGAIATAFAEYFLRVIGLDPQLPPNDGYVHYVAAIAIAVVAAINYVGLSWSALLQNATTLAKFAGLVLIIGAAFILGGPAHATAHVSAALDVGASTARTTINGASFGIALVSVLWAYDGWSELAYLSGEVQNPKRNVPLALILGTAIVVALYALANLAYLHVLTVDEIAHSKLVAADVAFRLIGAPGVTFVAITVMVSTFGALNGSILTTPRAFFAAAGDGLLFRPVAKVHPRFRTPHIAIVVTALLGIAFVMLRTFEQLADTFITAMLPFYALSVASVFVFRRKGVHSSFRTPLYPLTPVIFIVATVYLIGSALRDATSRGPTLGVFAVILLGVPVYWLTVARRDASGINADERS